MSYDCIQEIAEGRSAQEVWDIATRALSALGFDRAIYGLTRHRRGAHLGDLQDALFLSSLPPHLGFDMTFFMKSPMFQWSLGHHGAKSWSWAAEAARTGALDRETLRVMHAARRAGIVAGYTIRFPDISPRISAVMGLVARPGLGQNAVDALWSDRGDEIHALCTTMHLRINLTPVHGTRRPLTPRQRETLEWVAEGKTTQDIVKIMGISPGMVEKHLRLARAALDVETTAHAIAKAAQINAIFGDNGDAQGTFRAGAAPGARSGGPA